eukprot:6410363-Amphidinium_carterae.1
MTARGQTSMWNFQTSQSRQKRGRHQSWMLKCKDVVVQVGELRDVQEVDMYSVPAAGSGCMSQKLWRDPS